MIRQYKSKGNKNWTKDKIEPQHTHSAKQQGEMTKEFLEHWGFSHQTFDQKLKSGHPGSMFARPIL